MQEYISLFHRNFPCCVREEATVERILSQPQNCVFDKRDENGNLIGAVVIEDNNILMLCVDKAYRRNGIGGELLAMAEEQVRRSGFDTVTAGAGKQYLMPGIPTGTPVVKESLEPDRVYPDMDESGIAFFRKHGYTHSWDCNCFDMRMDLQDFSAVPFVVDGITYRIAEPADLKRAVACTDDAHKSFSKYYRNPALYDGSVSQKVLLAEADGIVVGTLMISLESEGTGLGSVGCTAVRHAYRGKKIATNMVILGTRMLKEAGMQQGFLGYTYTGLDKMYGCAGYKICVYYFMAAKKL